MVARTKRLAQEAHAGPVEDGGIDKGILYLVGSMDQAIKALQRDRIEQRDAMDQLRREMREDMGGLEASIRQIAHGITTAVDSIRDVKDRVGDLEGDVKAMKPEVADYVEKRRAAATTLDVMSWQKWIIRSVFGGVMALASLYLAWRMGASRP